MTREQVLHEIVGRIDIAVLAPPPGEGAADSRVLLLLSPGLFGEARDSGLVRRVRGGAGRSCWWIDCLHVPVFVGGGRRDPSATLMRAWRLAR